MSSVISRNLTKIIHKSLQKKHQKPPIKNCGFLHENRHLFWGFWNNQNQRVLSMKQKFAFWLSQFSVWFAAMVDKQAPGILGVEGFKLRNRKMGDFSIHGSPWKIILCIQSE